MKAPFHTPMLMAALAATALTAYSSQATTLISNTFGQRSFWDPSVWLPAQTPGPGDTVRIGNVAPELFLGDFAAFPAQSGQISRIHFDGTSAIQSLHWESKLTGGQSGGLSFSQDDPADFGVGIRIGGRTLFVPSQNQAIFFNAENSQAEAMNIRIGGGPFSDRDSSDGLTLCCTAPTFFYADNVILDSAGRTQLLIGGTKLVVNRLTVATAIDGRVLVAGGTLTATEASLTNSSPGTSQVPLVVGNGSSATIDTLTFQAIGLGSESTIQIGSTVPALRGGGTASFGDVSAFATGGGTAKFVVDGGDGVSSLVMKTLSGAGDGGGKLELQAVNGGHLTIKQATLANSPSTPGQLNILIDGARSQLIGGAGSAPLPGSIDVLNGAVKLDFSNGGACVDCELHVDAAGDATVSGDSTIEFTRIKMNGRDRLFASGPTSGTITKSAKTGGAPEVIAGSVNVDSNFVLHADGSKLGGDLSFIPAPPGPPVPAPPPTAGSHLTLELGSRLRIGGVPVLNEAPFLAIGKLGEVTLDATSSVFIGDPLATPSYVPGKITLATGGSIYGNGVINGIGFPSDTHPTVLNTGGTLHPGFSPGKLTIDGQYIQQDGELELEIGGPNPGEYDVLDASQGAQFLGGTIRIVLLNNFVAVNGTRFDFFGSSGLNFFDPSLSIIDETGLGLVFNFSTGAATIGAPVPLPPTAPLFALGCFGLLGIGWRRQHGRVLAANSRVPG